MLRHEVIMKLRGRVDEETMLALTRQIRRLAASIPLVRGVRLGYNRAETYRHLMFVVVLDDDEALLKYNAHPAHGLLVDVCTPRTEWISVADVHVTPSRPPYPTGWHETE